MLTFTSPSGFTVLVGKNCKENHTISTAIIRGTDLWFHAAGIPGAHVLLQLSKHDKAAQEDMDFCRELALQHSSLKKQIVGKLQSRVTMANGCEVTYVRGSPIGCVHIVSA